MRVVGRLRRLGKGLHKRKPADKNPAPYTSTFNLVKPNSRSYQLKPTSGPYLDWKILNWIPLNLRHCWPTPELSEGIVVACPVGIGPSHTQPCRSMGKRQYAVGGSSGGGECAPARALPFPGLALGRRLAALLAFSCMLPGCGQVMDRFQADAARLLNALTIPAPVAPSDSAPGPAPATGQDQPPKAVPLKPPEPSTMDDSTVQGTGTRPAGRASAAIPTGPQDEKAGRQTASTGKIKGGDVGPQSTGVFQDCTNCPQMLVVRSGSFRMGSPQDEAGRDPDEGPTRQVSVTSFALGRTEVTRRQWRAFQKATDYRTVAGCLAWTGDGYELKESLSWERPGFEQSDDHPVVCINWRDAQAYAAWLSSMTGRRYRLPRSSEWEYAARASTTLPTPWAGQPAEVCSRANVADQSLRKIQPQWPLAACSDGHTWTAPVGSFSANAWGLYDMHGNVMEWVQDCWTPSQLEPGEQFAPLSCTSRVIRGGSWDLPDKFARSAYRGKAGETRRGNAVGLRVARDLP